MTDKTMTLDALRDWHAEGANACYDRGDEAGYIFHSEAADAITRHLSQPAERGEAVAPAAEVSKLLAHAERMGYMVDTAVPLDLLRSILTALTAPPAERVRVPDAKVVPYGSLSGDKDYAYGYEKGHADGWNACRTAMLSATPSPTIDVAAVTKEVRK